MESIKHLEMNQNSALNDPGQVYMTLEKQTNPNQIEHYKHYSVWSSFIHPCLSTEQKGLKVTLHKQWDKSSINYSTESDDEW